MRVSDWGIPPKQSSPDDTHGTTKPPTRHTNHDYWLVDKRTMPVRSVGSGHYLRDWYGGQDGASVLLGLC